MTMSLKNQDEFEELYQEVLLDHYKRPRHFHILNPYDVKQPGKNPLCGDELTLYIGHDGEGRLTASFEGHGCSISTASASIMVDAIQGKSPAEAKALIHRFEAIIRQQNHAKQPVSKDIDLEDDIEALAGVSKFPVRIKCAALAWKALELALEELQGSSSKVLDKKPGNTVTTE